MKALREFAFSPQECRRELDEYRVLLDAHPELSERKDILPFFRKRDHLSAFVGSYIAYINKFDRLAHEYDVFGDFAADLVVGDSKSRTYCFVEFEDGGRDSVFVQRKGKATPEWSVRFEHGFSQLVDWFWKLDDMRVSVDFTHRFGRAPVRYHGMLVIGRRTNIQHREEQRLAWRLDNVLINSRSVHCITYDDLYEDLNVKLGAYGLLYRAEAQADGHAQGG